MSLLDAGIQLQCCVQDSWVIANASADYGKPSIDVQGAGILPILKGGSNPTRKVPQMSTLNKLCFLCLSFSVSCIAGRQELSWELEAPASWHVMSPPWPQSTSVCPFPPPAPQKQHPSEREEEQAAGFMGPGGWEIIWKVLIIRSLEDGASDSSYNPHSCCAL